MDPLRDELKTALELIGLQTELASRVWMTSELAYRWYGDEFAALGEEADQQILERLEAELEQYASLAPEVRAPILVYEIEARTILALNESLALDLARRWSYRDPMLECMQALQTPEQEATLGAGTLQSVLVQGERCLITLDIDLGRLEQAEMRLQGLESRYPGDSFVQETRCQLDFASRRFRYVRAPDLPEAEDYRPIRESTRSLELQARLRVALDELLEERVSSDAVGELIEEARAFASQELVDFASGARVLLAAAELRVGQGDFPSAREVVEPVIAAMETAGADDSLLRFELDILLGSLARAEVAAELDSPGATDLQRRVLDGWRGFRESWGNAPQLEGGIGFLHTYGRRLLFLEGLLAARALGGDELAFEELIAVQQLGGFEQRHGLVTPELDELTAQLDSLNAGIVCFVPGDRSTWIVGVDSRGVQWFETASPYLLRDRASTLAKLLRRPQPEDREQANELAAQLGGEFWTEELVEWCEPNQHLVLVGTGYLDALEPETLVFREGLPLGLCLATSRASSIAAFSELSGRQQASEAPSNGLGEELVVGATGVASQGDRWSALDPLPDVSWEDFGGPTSVLQRTVEEGADASLNGLAGALSPDHRLLTVLAHGLRDSSRLRPSGMLLAGEDGQGSEVWSEDLREIEVPELCVLLVCGAAMGQGRRGDGGSSHLASTFFEGGARSVLSSARPLEMSLALEIYDAWRRELCAGRTTSQALLEAKRSLAERRGAAFAASAIYVLGSGTEKL